MSINVCGANRDVVHIPEDSSCKECATKEEFDALAEDVEIMSDTLGGAVDRITTLEDCCEEVQETVSNHDTAINEIKEELTQLEVTGTASGAIASFDDGADGKPVKSLTVDIDPVQDLHGYDAPWVGGAGKNKLPFIPNGEPTKYGITVSYNEDEDVYIINGTATAQGNIIISNLTNIDWTVGDTYTMSFTKVGGSITIGEGSGITFAISIFNSNYSSWFRGSTNPTDIESSMNVTGSAFDATNAKLLMQNWRIGTVFDNVKFKVQIESGSTATSWTPYSNICPISGWTGAVVTRNNQNLISIDGAVVPSYNANAGAQLINPTTQTVEQLDDGIQITTTGAWGGATVMTPELKSGTYVLHGLIPDSTARCTSYVMDATNTIISRIANYASAYTMNINVTVEDGQKIALSIAKAEVGSLKIAELQVQPVSYTSYAPENTNTYPITFPDTVYGGTLEVETGVLTVDHALTDLGSLNYGYSTGFGTYFLTTDLTSIKASGSFNVISDIYATGTSPSVQDMSDCQIIGNAQNGYLFIRDLRFDNVPDFKSAVSGHYICYELATPQTIQLTPTEVTTLLGNNNIYADTGDVDVTYVRDLNIVINKLLS